MCINMYFFGKNLYEETEFEILPVFSFSLTQAWSSRLGGLQWSQSWRIGLEKAGVFSSA